MIWGGGTKISREDGGRRGAPRKSTGVHVHGKDFPGCGTLGVRRIVRGRVPAGGLAPPSAPLVAQHGAILRLAAVMDSVSLLLYNNIYIYIYIYMHKVYNIYTPHLVEAKACARTRKT